MKSSFILFLFAILFIAVAASFFYQPLMLEGFANSNYLLGEYPSSENRGILGTDSFPSTGNSEVSSYTERDIWWHYPIFKVGSYKQITNNIRYPNNPDEGTCMPAEFCGTLYKEKKGLPSNYIKPLPPVPEGAGSRVNYYRTADDLMPFTNPGNILY